jgi:hypothetical protein
MGPGSIVCFLRITFHHLSYGHFALRRRQQEKGLVCFPRTIFPHLSYGHFTAWRSQQEKGRLMAGQKRYEHYIGQSEPTPTTTPPWMDGWMDGAWTGHYFSLGSCLDPANFPCS